MVVSSYISKNAHSCFCKGRSTTIRMADADGGGGSKLSVGGFISPGIGIVKSWQGIVEISLRGVLIVSFPTFTEVSGLAGSVG